MEIVHQKNPKKRVGTILMRKQAGIFFFLPTLFQPIFHVILYVKYIYFICVSFFVRHQHISVSPIICSSSYRSSGSTGLCSPPLKERCLPGGPFTHMLQRNSAGFENTVVSLQKYSQSMHNVHPPFECSAHKAHLLFFCSA